MDVKSKQMAQLSHFCGHHWTPVDLPFTDSLSAKQTTLREHSLGVFCAQNSSKFGEELQSLIERSNACFPCTRNEASALCLVE